MIINLSNGKFDCTVSTLGGRILRLSTKEGFNLLQKTAEEDAPADATGGFPLVPLCNRVEHDGYEIEGRAVALPRTSPGGTEYLHGLAWRREWQVLECREDKVVLGLKEDWSPCPYAFETALCYELAKTSLVIRLKVKALNDQPLYYGLGFHPYFEADEGTLLCFKAEAASFMRDDGTYFLKPLSDKIPAKWDFSKEKTLPDGFANHCYLSLNDPVTLRRGNRLITLACTPNLPYLMYYQDGGGKFVALERQSHGVDAVHGDPQAQGLAALSRGQSMEAALSIALTALKAG